MINLIIENGLVRCGYCRVPFLGIPTQLGKGERFTFPERREDANGVKYSCVGRHLGKICGMVYGQEELKAAIQTYKLLSPS